MNKKFYLFLLLIGIYLGCGMLISGESAGDKISFHIPEEIRSFMTPIDSGEFFLYSEQCRACHGFDTLGNANVDAQGNDINLFDDWQSTMMANSARDPLWRAKVSHEILVNPALSDTIQDKCTSCHAPMGHFTSVFKGMMHYNIATLDTDSLGMDGVACGGCHEIGTQNLGSVYSGNIPYDTTKKEFGPFQNPVTGPMQLYVGLLPTYSNHVSQSAFCSSCHTLITPSLDLAGNYTGRTFVEQATYQEWLNSVMPADNITCQKCHMPQITDSVIIANGILNLPKRSPFNRHKFVGGNSFMVELIKNNKSALGSAVEDKYFDSTIAATNRLLTQNTLQVQMTLDSIESDTAFIKLRLTNLAGHKFPSGYPSRRAVVQFVGIDSNNDTVFQSGIFDNSFEVRNLSVPFEPHYNIINDTTQVQIYEMVMGDVNGNKTTLLLRADSLLKDNRMVPEGFTTTSLHYDTIRISGDALSDIDFNKDISGNEGTGRDFIHYHIPVSGVNGTVHFYARVFYQSVPPGWLTEMFSHSTVPIDTFKYMYQSANRNPVYVNGDSMDIFVSSIHESAAEDLKVFPSPVTSGGICTITCKYPIDQLDVFSVSGKKTDTYVPAGKKTTITLQMPVKSGIYLLRISAGGRHIVRKILVGSIE
jgi:hypothetical protein